MPASGDVVTPADVIVRVGDATPLTADSATWNATESAALHTVTADLINGERYAIRWAAMIASATVAAGGEANQIKLREDSATGTQIQLATNFIPSTNGGGYSAAVYGEYTAVATGSKTFVITAIRILGSNSSRVTAGSNRPVYFTVDRIVDTS